MGRKQRTVIDKEALLVIVNVCEHYRNNVSFCSHRVILLILWHYRTSEIGAQKASLRKFPKIRKV